MLFPFPLVSGELHTDITEVTTWLFLFLALSEPEITALILIDKAKFPELTFRTFPFLLDKISLCKS